VADILAEIEASGIDIEELIGGGMSLNPLTMGLMTGGNILGDIIGNIFSDDPQEQYMQMMLQEKSELLPKIKALPEGYNEGDVVKRMSLMKEALGPMMDKISFGAGEGPQGQRIASGAIASLLAGKEFDIRSHFDRLGERRKEFKYGTLSRMV
jgi:hypothetical protein